MNMFMDAIQQEQRRIQRVADLTAASLRNAPAGNLSLEKRGNSFYCYAHDYRGGNQRRRYLGVPASAAAQALLDARFQRERLKRLEHDRELLSNLEKCYQNYDPQSIFDTLPKNYRDVARFARTNGQLPGVPDFLKGDSRLAQRYLELKKWATADYERNNAPFGKGATYAIDGRRVRSKGECVHYNLQLEHGILFRYDCVMEFIDSEGRTKLLSPDFLIQCFDGTFVIVEHLGMLSERGYAIDFGEKCYWYMQSGFIPGTNFFVTSDDIHGGTDSQQILNVVKQVDRLFYGY